MAKKVKKIYSEHFAFYEQLWFFYQDARGKIRSRYKTLTKKFLDYNDRNENPSAFLRPPQFEALEMYVFIKEFLKNQQVIDIFEQWVNKTGDFSDRSYYSNGQANLFAEQIKNQTATIFKQMEKYKADYPNYIYALTMGLGKTILMAACIFYEFLLSNKYPKDELYCHNVLVFAPDKTVLQSLREIVTFDKTKVVPPEYASVLDANIKIHFLDDTSTSLNTIDNSNLNIIITNNQKIIVRHKHKEQKPGDKFFQASHPSLLSPVYDDEDLVGDEDLLVNKRFQKLCRLPQIGIYVDEAHHLFGANLESDLYSDKETSQRMTINMLAERLKKQGTNVVACYNYTGTPYVKKQVLPEVVYAYGLRESIYSGFLKEADVKGFTVVKDIEFLRSIINGYTDPDGNKFPGFLDIYKNKTYEGLLPKLAIYAANVDEIRKIIKPALEKLLSEKGIPLSKILVNVGDGNPDLTKDDDIRHFNNLDVVGTEGSLKQFILLCEKGKEGWNCRSLFGVALFRDSFSKVFVLQSTMRCLRQIKADDGSPKQKTATIYLSQANYQILDEELNKNFNMSVKELANKNNKNKQPYKVRMIPPPRKLTIKERRYNYNITKKQIIPPINFDIDNIDITQYQRKVTEKTALSGTGKDNIKIITDIADKITFSLYMMVAEIARFFPEAGALKIENILENSEDGISKILEKVNSYNEVLYEHIIPKIFYSIYDVSGSHEETIREIVLLKMPEGKEYFDFHADPALVVFVEDENYKKYKNKSFHADHYCFDSNPEYECFKKFLNSDKVEAVYFTGMFTSLNQNGLAIPYTDPESYRYRNYYPDFLVKMKDGSYQIIEVKGDNKLDNNVVKKKQEAARALATDSEMIYRMIASSAVSQMDITDPKKDRIYKYPETPDSFGIGLAADSGDVEK
jgi:hypothetical protein